jgi:(E)-2-((N-methylformamido)methylene)succinate hydrolase
VSVADFQHQRMPDGTHVASVGSGPPMVFLHGLGLDHAMWAPLAQFLAPRFRLVCIDLLGHGENPRPAADSKLDGYAAQVIAVLDHLDIRAAAVVGCDLGGQVALATAYHYADRVNQLILLGTAYRRLKAQRDMMLKRIEQARKHGPEANADSAIQRWFSAAFQSHHKPLTDGIRARIATTEPVGYLMASKLYAWADTYTADMLRDINCPVLLLAGALDMGTTPDMARRLARALAHAKLIVVPRQRHMLALEVPDIVSESIVEFLAAAEP